VLQRDADETGVSGTGVVAEGVRFSDGTVALRWTSQWPTSVVFHDRGIESVEAVHGHGGKTRIVWQDFGGSIIPITMNSTPVSHGQGYISYACRKEGHRECPRTVNQNSLCECSCHDPLDSKE
jgi:hypothetical protein